MENDELVSVKCPHCDAKISKLSFRMIPVEEDRFTEERMDAMKREIARLKDELENGEDLDSKRKVLYKNQIEHIEMQLQNNIVVYRERVYYCPSCEKILAVIPANDINGILELVSSTAFDIRKLK